MIDELHLKDNNQAIHEIVSLFKKLKAKDPRCDRILCSTCGGYGTAVREQLTHNDLQNINEVLSQITPEELRMFGVWTMILEKINPYGISAIHERAAKSIDLSDIRAVDRFLFARRRDYESSSYEKDYLNVLDHAISMAVETSDASLVETLIIILGERAFQFPELVTIAITLSKKDEEMQRVLYNCLRETVPEVRGYIGLGITVHPSVQPWY